MTTTYQASEQMIERANTVASYLSTLYVPRYRGIGRMLRDHDAALAYVVSHECERIEDESEHLFINPGTLSFRRQDGLSSPFLQALAPDGQGSIKRVIDGTLGLAQDALHLAAMLDVDVLGIEASLVMQCLLTEGLPRIAQMPLKGALAASNISLLRGDATLLLGQMAAKSADVVYLDPMYTNAQAHGAVPGYRLLRLVASHQPLTVELLHEALRVASQRVVIKGPKAEAMPALLAPFAPSAISSQRRTFWIIAC